MAPLVPQAVLEKELKGIVASAAMPRAYAEAVDAAFAFVSAQGKASRRATAQDVDGRLERLKRLWEEGDLSWDEYTTRRDAANRRKQELVEKAQPVFIRQQSALRSLTDDWEVLTVDEKKRALALMFNELVWTPKESESLIFTTTTGSPTCAQRCDLDRGPLSGRRGSSTRK